MTKNVFNLNVRLAVACFVALSVSLPMAWISLAKVVLFVTALSCLVWGAISPSIDRAFSTLKIPHIILLAMVTYALSLIWTQADHAFALSALVKHGKLMTIVLLTYLIRTTFEARYVMLTFIAGQAFLILSSWLLAIGFHLPWVTDAVGNNVVFSTYLDQSIMFAASAGVLWHMRDAGLTPKWAMVGLSALGFGASLFLLEGRTGYLVSLLAIGLATWWATPRKFRWHTTFLMPLFLVGLLVVGSPHFRDRVGNILHGTQAYTAHNDNKTSEGWRLNSWKRSVQAIAESPFIGHGVGTWAIAVKTIEGKDADTVFGKGISSNPHQEFLLWSVDLGVGGFLLLMSVFYAAYRDSGRFAENHRRALISLLAVTALACCFNSALYDDLMGDYLCAALGVMLALGLRSKLEQPDSLKPILAPSHG
jgi:O-antigen ligase